MSRIALNAVTKTYSVGDQIIRAVSDVTLEINKGDFISIVGHSGSGKTTLLSMIGGITSPSSGSILFDGVDLSALGSDQLSEYRSRKIGFMFQFASLLPMLTVQENLMLPTAFTEQPELLEKAGEKAAELLKLVGLADKIGHFPPQLSGGQQRRVAIARAFINDPVIILADEPTGDLDEDTEMDMMNFIKTMNNAYQTTFIMVTHNTDLAKKAQRRLRMTQGLLQEQ